VGSDAEHQGLGVLIFTATLGDGAWIMGLIMPVAIGVVCLWFVCYARWMAKAGILR